MRRSLGTAVAVWAFVAAPLMLGVSHAQASGAFTEVLPAGNAFRVMASATIGTLGCEIESIGYEEVTGPAPDGGAEVIEQRPVPCGGQLALATGPIEHLGSCPSELRGEYGSWESPERILWRDPETLLVNQPAGIDTTVTLGSRTPCLYLMYLSHWSAQAPIAQCLPGFDIAIRDELCEKETVGGIQANTLASIDLRALDRSHAAECIKATSEAKRASRRLRQAIDSLRSATTPRLKARFRKHVHQRNVMARRTKRHAHAICHSTYRPR